MRKGSYLFSSESVTEGHPDKVADQVSDAILDAIIAEDPNCRVAAETLVKTGFCMVAGEVTTSSYVEIPEIVRSNLPGIQWLHDGGVISVLYHHLLRFCRRPGVGAG